jgi:hypothetical protein
VKRKLRRSRQRKSSRKSTANAYRPPRSAKELFARPRKFQKLWNRVTQVPAEMRSKRLSLNQAARQFDVSPKVVVRLIGAAFRRKRNGQYAVKPSDRLLRVLLVPSKKGLREIVVKGSRQASIVGKYSSAVEKFLRTRDAAALRKLRRKSVTDAAGKRVRLLTNFEELENQASAGVLHFESLYGRTT